MFQTCYDPEYLSSDLFSEGVINGFSTRRGGVSKPPRDSMNLDVKFGEDLQDIYENYRRLGAALGFTPEQAVLAFQVHGSKVDRVGRADTGVGLLRPYGEAQDGLCTNEPGVALVVFSADCTPILLYDPVKRAIGAVHSGWKGTAQGIVARCVEKMTEEFGSDPADLEAAIGPSIGSCCFETDRDVPEAMVAALGPEAEPLSFITHPDARPGKFFPDVKQLNVLWLRRSGVKKIDVCLSCTRCQPHRFWSARYSRAARGNMGAVIMLKEEA